MTEEEEESVDDLLDSWNEFTDSDDDTDEQPDEQTEDTEPGPEGDEEGGIDMGAIVEEQFDQMGPDNMELMDVSLDEAMVTEDDEPDEEDGEDTQEATLEIDDSDPCYGTGEMSLARMEDIGDLKVSLNFTVADAIQGQTILNDEPTDTQLEKLHPQMREEIDEINEDLNSDQFEASREDTLEIHWDDEDFEEVHAAIARVMSPTEDKLKRDPDAEITPDSLLKVARKSCHEDYDSTRLFGMSREGDSDEFVKRGPWTGRRMNVRDLIDELSQIDAQSDDGILVVVHAVPFK